MKSAATPSAKPRLTTSAMIASIAAELTFFIML